MPLSVTLVVHTTATGTLARAQVLSGVFEHLGHRTRVVSTRGAALWAPLRHSAFAARCSVLSRRALSDVVAADTDLLVPVKALPRSLGLAWRLSRRHGVPLLVDVDDPEVEVRTTWMPPLQVVLRFLANPAAFVLLRALRRVARRLPGTVSTPVLQDVYGGELVPHARPDPGPGAPHTSTAPLVGFIGTVRPHKGLEEQRRAVAHLADRGWRLLVTADPPPDAQPWEAWVGAGAGDTQSLLAACDVVVISSTPAGYGAAQLPLKLVDAMIAGRAVVVSDTGPLPWAAGPGIPTYTAGDVVLALPQAAWYAGAQALAERAVRRGHPHAAAPRVMTLRAMGEQVPNPRSRVRLLEERDAFGVPVAELDWQLTDVDWASMARSQQLLLPTLRAALGARVDSVLDAVPRPHVVGGAHHMGTTRMAASPRDGVVDPDGLVHGVRNLYVTGSSVFPTCGSANPTLTVVALALRLAAHLRERLGPLEVRGGAAGASCSG